MRRRSRKRTSRVAMNTGTQAAKEAGNMVDLDSNPTKLIEVVETGKQMLMTRGSLTTFSIANDVAKYFAIIPGGVCDHISAARGVKCDALGKPLLGHPRGSHLQCAHHHVFDTSRPEGGQVSAAGRGHTPATQFTDLRARGYRRSVVGIKLIDMVLELSHLV